MGGTMKTIKTIVNKKTGATRQKTIYKFKINPRRVA